MKKPPSKFQFQTGDKLGHHIEGCKKHSVWAMTLPGYQHQTMGSPLHSMLQEEETYQLWKMGG